ncbi:hypothetical protein [Sporisorium scitamineum]|uniref:Uncharacterized protein n=1 Tax=Sporisorium scitamineum TaxID=49012 RepID=A0A0F7S8Y5_9BASI|nr:hypothetical protein [Sporisorium scitamineum]
MWTSYLRHVAPHRGGIRTHRKMHLDWSGGQQVPQLGPASTGSRTAVCVFVG